MAKLTPTQVGVTTPTNAGASNKSAQASVPSVPAGMKKWLWLAMVAIIIVGTIALIASVARSGNNAKQPTASTSYKQPDKAMMLTIQPGGKSERIPVPYQMHVDMNGKDFRFNCVYADGHEESFVPGERSCSNGDMPFVYATNIRTDGPNVITYSYEK